jgi:cytochrome c-type biogenesis protein CcmH/NrfF
MTTFCFGVYIVNKSIGSFIKQEPPPLTKRTTSTWPFPFLSLRISKYFLYSSSDEIHRIIFFTALKNPHITVNTERIGKIFIEKLDQLIKKLSNNPF